MHRIALADEYTIPWWRLYNLSFPITTNTSLEYIMEANCLNYVDATAHINIYIPICQSIIDEQVVFTSCIKISHL